MIKFIKESLAELEHVVWPTPTETRKYMNYTVGVIVVMATFLAILSFSLRSSLYFARDQFPHDASQNVTVSSEAATQEDLEKALEKIQSKKTGSGNGDGVSTASGVQKK